MDIFKIGWSEVTEANYLLVLFLKTTNICNSSNSSGSLP